MADAHAGSVAPSLGRIAAGLGVRLFACTLAAKLHTALLQLPRHLTARVLGPNIALMAALEGVRRANRGRAARAGRPRLPLLSRAYGRFFARGLCSLRRGGE